MTLFMKKHFGLSFTYLKPLQCKTVKTDVLPNTGSPHYNPEEKNIISNITLDDRHV